MKSEEKNKITKLKVKNVEEYDEKIEKYNTNALLNGLATGISGAAAVFALCNASNITSITTDSEFFSNLIYLIGGFACMGVSGTQLKKLIENIAAKVMYQDKLNSLKEEYLLEDEDIIDRDSSFEDVIYNDESEIDIDANFDSTINIKHVHTLNIK